MKKSNSEENAEKIGISKKMPQFRPTQSFIYTDPDLFWENLTQNQPMALIRIQH